MSNKKGALLNHSAKVHGKGLEQLLKCEDCDYRTPLKEKLLLHFKRVHSIGNKFRDELYENRFSRKIDSQ